jgi:hypothetical protein
LVQGGWVKPSGALRRAGDVGPPITDDICRLFGEHCAKVRQRNFLIGDVDLLIAATPHHHDLTVLARNRRHFQRIPDLRIISTAIPLKKSVAIQFMVLTLVRAGINLGENRMPGLLHNDAP